jgi:hypothetical protein
MRSNTASMPKDLARRRVWGVRPPPLGGSRLVAALIRESGKWCRYRDLFRIFVELIRGLPVEKPEARDGAAALSR